MQGDDIGCGSEPFWELWQFAMEASHPHAMAKAHSPNLGHHAGSTELFLAAGLVF